MQRPIRLSLNLIDTRHGPIPFPYLSMFTPVAKALMLFMPCVVYSFRLVHAPSVRSGPIRTIPRYLRLTVLFFNQSCNTPDGAHDIYSTYHLRPVKYFRMTHGEYDISSLHCKRQGPTIDYYQLLLKGRNRQKGRERECQAKTATSASEFTAHSRGARSEHMAA